MSTTHSSAATHGTSHVTGAAGGLSSTNPTGPKEHIQHAAHVGNHMPTNRHDGSLGGFEHKAASDLAAHDGVQTKDPNDRFNPAFAGAESNYGRHNISAEQDAAQLLEQKKAAHGQSTGTSGTSSRGHGTSGGAGIDSTNYNESGKYSTTDPVGKTEHISPQSSTALGAGALGTGALGVGAASRHHGDSQYDSSRSDVARTGIPSSNQSSGPSSGVTGGSLNPDNKYADTYGSTNTSGLGGSHSHQHNLGAGLDSQGPIGQGLSGNNTSGYSNTSSGLSSTGAGLGSHSGLSSSGNSGLSSGVASTGIPTGQQGLSSTSGSGLGTNSLGSNTLGSNVGSTGSTLGSDSTRASASGNTTGLASEIAQGGYLDPKHSERGPMTKVVGAL